MMIKNIIQKLKEYKMKPREIRRVNKRLESTKEYVDALQDKYSKLNVIRIDLSYKKPFSDDITLEDANSDFNKMLNNRRNNDIFDNNVGYICKKEFTEDKGVHFHTVFFYNGQNVKNDVLKAKQIGQYWNEKITAKKGSSHNCNIDAEKIYGDNNAVGMLDHNNSKKREKLDDALSYLCKEDYQSLEQLQGNSKDRGFVRGAKPKKKSTKGRPRNK